ncbi:deoxyguanosinetriphosphate triphosphohydrolase [Cocleimonas sp. KMM 6892]|uniref:deoxyguanosinetriphosphate triphosphohydrolase n=1 Tax=unclassified Cocleimonas TaxID=2639732 RepID=UPI002DBD8686|nr:MULTISPECIES: deoxyguanosinetriphosphate triphosphohydrolase [unclassified Cocleimonas]MEB8432458.1 deoxyguanosinetriphosphate triphosphohydrolase [Cocleimonas sp. KMM 6892]MEC4715317.1 deoxyguanosinetriphosphate triphosphohydrolase [Cocleimonas sp. KMM 6895]MEC4745064.1 deoxyguanosinetriphosphate triphosphohydrolase [Cocleimonas sp. KMM 6896]
MKAPYAASPEFSKGRKFSEPAPTYRSEFQRDRDRIIHSTGFRRLEYKTQVFVNHEGDLYRTRLTHSLEVAQIARSIARTLNLDEDLTEAISLAHDIGHTPFGHAGQDALNACMKDYGGFEHNLQSLRIIDELEKNYADFNGLNLCYETREGVLKHCSLKNAANLGDVGERFLKKEQPSLEAQLTNIADQIAYNNHDIDDGIRSGLINIEQMRQMQLFSTQYDKVMWKYPELKGNRRVHETIRRMIGEQVVDLVETSRAKIAEVNPESIEDVRKHSEQLISFSDEMRVHNQELKKYLRENLYFHHKVYRMTRKAHQVIEALFDIFMHDLRLLPPGHLKLARNALVDEGLSGQARVIADYVAGMTDRYATKEYARLFGVDGNVF